MKWQGRRSSRNIEDRRGSSAARAGGVGGIGILLIVVIGWLLGVDPSFLLQGQGDSNVSSSARPPSAEEEQAAQFVSVVLADTEQVWDEIFQTELGQRYNAPILVLFSHVTSSPCGNASGATGPF